MFYLGDCPRCGGTLADSQQDVGDRECLHCGFVLYAEMPAAVLSRRGEYRHHPANIALAEEKRERLQEVKRLKYLGIPKADIAQALRLSVKTVAKYLQEA